MFRNTINNVLWADNIFILQSGYTSIEDVYPDCEMNIILLLGF